MQFLLLCILSLYSTVVAAATYNDKDLADTLAESHRTHSKLILYTWSPHMVLSQKGLRELRMFKKNYHAIVVLDPKCNFTLAQQMARRNGWPDEVLRTLESADLIKKGFRTHYPSYIFVKDGKFKSSVVPGYKLPGELDRLAKRYLE